MSMDCAWAAELLGSTSGCEHGGMGAVSEPPSAPSPDGEDGLSGLLLLLLLCDGRPGAQALQPSRKTAIDTRTILRMFTSTDAAASSP